MAVDVAPLRRQRQAAFILAIVIALVSVGLAGCSVQLVAPYDEQTFNTATDALRKIESFFLKMEHALDGPSPSEEAKYESNVAFYDDVKVNLALLRARAQAIPKNEDTVKLIDLFIGQFEDLEKLHKAGLNRRLLDDTRNAMKRTVNEILRTEFAKRRR